MKCEKMNLGATVRARRVELRISQPEVAKRVGTSQSHVSRIETNRCVPSVVMLAKLANALQMPVAELLEAAQRKAV
ncbi:MAG: helix-turn-helix transcriptional regulator [Ruminococcus sp.]|nr:helix-turn-helix transcriptional regulator [Ruminococcus sp.]